MYGDYSSYSAEYDEIGDAGFDPESEGDTAEEAGQDEE